MPIKNTRLNNTALIRWRNACPSHMPNKAGASANNEALISPPPRLPRQANPAASASVDTLNDSPNACTN